MKIVWIIGLALSLGSCKTRSDGTQEINPAYAKIAADALSAALAQAISDSQAGSTDVGSAGDGVVVEEGDGSEGGAK